MPLLQCDAWPCNALPNVAEAEAETGAAERIDLFPLISILWRSIVNDNRLTTRSLRASLCSMVLALAACGGGGDSAPPAPTVGAAGGTVAGPNGAQVVVPAGALAANTAIAVAQSSSGSPALPAGMNAVGAMFAFTPHATSFAAPVTVTVPFDPASVPTGATLSLFKTNAANAWERVANASANAGTMTAQVTSFSFLLVGAVAPQITAQPASVAVTQPATASFSVTAIGFDPPFTFQWQKSDDAGVTFSDIAGATASSYTTGPTSIAADHGDRYRVLVSSIGGTTTSAAATLTVTGTVVAPSVTTQPQNVTANAGAGASFSVVATGSNLVYQWQKNGTPIAGQTNASLNLSNVQAADAGGYTVVVSNLVNGAAVNSVTSNTATLTVMPTGSLNLTGTWISNYQCTGSGGNFPGQDTLTVTQTGTSVSFTSSDGGSFTGTLNGNNMSYSGGGPGYTETGTWTLQGPNNFSKTSNYTRTDGSGLGGSCPGTGQRQAGGFTLTVNVTGNGTVSEGSGGINLCRPQSGDCTQAYPSGTQVTLFATENAPGVAFNGWGGDCTDIPSPFAARVVMDSNKTCTASFSP